VTARPPPVPADRLLVLRPCYMSTTGRGRKTSPCWPCNVSNDPGLAPVAAAYVAVFFDGHMHPPQQVISALCSPFPGQHRHGSGKIPPPFRSPNYPGLQAAPPQILGKGTHQYYT
jgi:hypothetical protein